MLLTRSPLDTRRCPARLACVKHAASVRPEPGSNSPSMTNTHQPHKSQQANHKQNQSRRKNPDPPPDEVRNRPGLSHHSTNHGTDCYEYAVEFSRDRRCTLRDSRPSLATRRTLRAPWGPVNPRGRVLQTRPYRPSVRPGNGGRRRRLPAVVMTPVMPRDAPSAACPRPGPARPAPRGARRAGRRGPPRRRP